MDHFLTPSKVINFLKEITEDSSLNISENSPLVGSSASIDSMTLVQLCLKLEEIAISMEFNFDWTSEKAMSAMNSTFRNPKSICDEFNSQLMNSTKGDL